MHGEEMGDYIAALRKSLNMTQSNFIEVSGMDIATLKRIETGATDPWSSTVFMMLNALSDFDVMSVLPEDLVEFVNGFESELAGESVRAFDTQFLRLIQKQDDNCEMPIYDAGILPTRGMMWLFGLDSKVSSHQVAYPNIRNDFELRSVVGDSWLVPDLSDFVHSLVCRLGRDKAGELNRTKLYWHRMARGGGQIRIGILRRDLTIMEDKYQALGNNDLGITSLADIFFQGLLNYYAIVDRMMKATHSEGKNAQEYFERILGSFIRLMRQNQFYDK